MAGRIHRFLADDHRRLDALFERATGDPEKIAAAAYAEFRSGLLKHIAMEEKVLMPAAQKRRGGRALMAAGRLRLDHAALVALLVPSPTPAIAAAIRAIFARHNPVEESGGGVYDQAEEAIGEDGAALLQQLQHFPEVKVLPHVDNDFVMDAARRALTRAGHADLKV
ncbi:MAG TPA: hemerythrin domain-containing protein [Candidatus Binatia bacterium]|nr:hemerythrin domain-containing protein [Candidatus Binatia bacterium]